MKSLMLLFRLIKINFIFAKHGLEDIVLATRLFAPLRFFVYLNPWYWLRNRRISRGVRLRHALEELGPIFVKLGQMLSTRADLLPDDIAKELALLQDKVPPFKGAKAIIEKAYEHDLSEIFSELNPEALASASIAQVHAAKLTDGQDVVVKVVRPGIRKQISRDIGLMYAFARLLERFWQPGKRLHLQEVIEEFEQTLNSELDLMREAANASQLRRNFDNSDLLYIPEVYWPYTRANVMVMERIYGIPVANIAALEEHNIDLKALAERGVEIFFTQVFRDCFFHADMHPGNIFVSPDNPQKPQYIAVDFGIMGTLSGSDQRYLAENMLAFFKRDYRRVAQLHVESGWVPTGTKVHEFEAAIRTVCEPIFERPLKDISCGQLLLRLLNVGKQFHMELLPQLVLLQKTLIHIESLGRQLYPDLDLWSTARPFLEHWLRQQMGPKAFIKKVRENMPFWLEKLPDIPNIIYSKLETPPETVMTAPKPIKTSNTNVKNNAVLQGVGLTLLFSAIVLLLTTEQIWPNYLNLPVLSWIFGVTGLIVFILASFKDNIET